MLNFAHQTRVFLFLSRFGDRRAIGTHFGAEMGPTWCGERVTVNGVFEKLTPRDHPSGFRLLFPRDIHGRLFVFHRLFEAVAFAVHLEDVAMVRYAIQERGHHAFALDDLLVDRPRRNILRKPR